MLTRVDRSIADNMVNTLLPRLVTTNSIFTAAWSPLSEILSLITIEGMTLSAEYKHGTQELGLGVSGMATLDTPTSSNDLVNVVLTILGDLSPHVFVSATISAGSSDGLDIELEAGFGLGITCLDARGTQSSCDHEFTFTDDSANTICCAESCGAACGTSDCASAPGGSSNCCAAPIFETKRVCGESPSSNCRLVIPITLLSHPGCDRRPR